MQVHLSFLYVGHTHEDIDAGFSRIADTLRRNDAETIPELLEHLPDPTEVIWQYNIRDWLEPFIFDVRKHTKPLHYKFYLDQITNKMKMVYKSNQAKPWKEAKTGMFEYDSRGKVQLPRDVPQIVQPSFEKMQVEKIESRLGDWKCLFSDQVENTQFKWWKQYIQYVKKLRDDASTMNTEVVSKATWLLNKLPRLDPPDETLEENTVPEEIVNMIEQELEEPEVGSHFPLQIYLKRKKAMV